MWGPVTDCLSCYPREGKFVTAKSHCHLSLSLSRRRRTLHVKHSVVVPNSASSFAFLSSIIDVDRDGPSRPIWREDLLYGFPPTVQRESKSQTVTPTVRFNRKWTL